MYLQHTEPAWWARIWYPLRYSTIVRAHAHNYDLNPALLAAVIDEESKFRADAKSSAGAVGLMQLLPATAKGIAIHTGGSKFVTSDLYNPEINVRYGAWYLHHLLQKYGDERARPRGVQRRPAERRHAGAPKERASSSRRPAPTSTRSSGSKASTGARMRTSWA